MTRRVVLGVLGDPLATTRSPELHRAGLAALGLAGESHALRTPPAALGARLAELRTRGFTGVNLTHPLKAVALEHLDRVSEAARRARSVNTVGFAPGETWGETTDGAGFVDWLASLGREAGGRRIVLLGAGGAARSVALALEAARPLTLTVSARHPAIVAPEWAGIPAAHLVTWRGAEERAALAAADMIVNTTPPAAELPAPGVAAMPAGALLLDLNYGPEVTPWVRAARAAGFEAVDGLGLLVFQGRRSLELWLARPVPVEPLAAAVGWPR